MSKLFIPRKGTNDVPSLDTNWRALEMWANQLVTGGTGTIEEITSVDDSVTITDPDGPITDLSVSGGGGGGITEIISEDGSVVIADPTGPTTNLSVTTYGTTFQGVSSPQSLEPGGAAVAATIVEDYDSGSVQPGHLSGTWDGSTQIFGGGGPGTLYGLYVITVTASLEFAPGLTWTAPISFNLQLSDRNINNYSRVSTAFASAQYTPTDGLGTYLFSLNVTSSMFATNDEFNSFPLLAAQNLVTADYNYGTVTFDVKVGFTTLSFMP